MVYDPSVIASSVDDITPEESLVDHPETATLVGMKDIATTTASKSVPKKSDRKPVLQKISNKRYIRYLKGLNQGPAPISSNVLEDLKAAPVSEDVVDEADVIASSVEHTTPEESLVDPPETATLVGMKDITTTTASKSVPKKLDRKPVLQKISNKRYIRYLEGLKQGPAPVSSYFMEEVKAAPASEDVVDEVDVIAPSTEPEESVSDSPETKEPVPLLRKALILGVGAVVGLIWENTEDVLDDPPL